MPREIKLKISLEGEKQVESGIDSIGEGLDDLDRVHAKSAKEALSQIDRSTFNQIKSQIKSVGSTLKEVGSQVKDFGQGITDIGQKLTVGFTLPIAAIATFGITSQASLEKAEISFTRFIKNSKGFTGSLEDARNEAKLLISELQGFSDKTPFESEEVIASGRALLAAKIPRQDIKDFLTDAGDLAAAANTNIEEVARAFARLKSGDFGEAFERLRDFGIGKEDLIGKGLEFDKNGAFKGSVEQALDGVRAVIKERFGGSIDDLSNSLAGRFSTLLDTGKAFFRELFQPAFEFAKPALDFVIEQITNVTTYLKTLSPETKAIIVGILGAIAALGPVLVFIGTLVAAVGGLIGAISSIAAGIAALGGLSVVLPIIAAVGAAIALLTAGVAAAIVVVYQIYEAWQKGFGPVASFVAIGVGAILTAISPILGLPVLIGSVLITLYQVWVTNFGGIRDFLVTVWNKIVEISTIAINAVYGLVQSVGSQIVAWWTENYPLIEETVNVVSESVKSIISGFLAAVQDFWDTHGTRILAVVEVIWNTVKGITSVGVSQVGNFIKFGLEIITGNWSAAWGTFLKILQNAFAIAVQFVKGYVGTVGSTLYAVIPVLVSFGIKFQLTLIEYVAKAVAGVIYVIATLPQQIARLIPVLIRAGASIGEAIIRGIRQGFAETATAGAEAIGGAAGGTFGTRFEGAKAGTFDNTPTNSISSISNLGSGGGGGSNAAKQAKETLTPIQELRKSAAEAKAALDFLYNNAEAQALKGQIDQTNELKSALDELIQVRSQSGINEGLAIPQGLGAIRDEVTTIKAVLDGFQDAGKTLIDFDKALNGLGQNATELEKVNAFLKDKTRTALLSDETKELLKSNAALVDRKNRTDEFNKSKAALIKSGADEILQLSEQLRLFGVTDEVEQQRIKNQYDLIRARRQLAAEGKSGDEIERLIKILELDQQQVLALREQLKLKKEAAEVDRLNADLQAGLAEEIASLNREFSGGVEVSRADALAKQLQTEAYKNLSQAQKDGLIAQAAQIDGLREAIKAQDEYRQQFERTADFIENKIEIFASKGFKGLFSSIIDDLKRFLIRGTAEFLASRFLKLITGQDAVFNQSGSGQSSSGGGIGNIFKNLLGGIFGGGNSGGIGGTPNFNPNAGLNTGDINALGQFVVNGNSPASSFSGNSNASGGGGILNLISGLFGGGRSGQPLGGTTSALGGILTTRDGTSINSPGVGGGILGQILGPGGLFGKQGFGFNSGTVSTLGAGAGLIGSLIGGRTGSILSGVGAGIGVAGSLASILGISALGGPVGLLIGGAVGGLIALFSQNSKRRQEEKLRTQYLREAIAGLGDFDKLITDLKNARIDPDSAIEQGNAIAETLRVNYLQQANSLTDKKTRRIAVSAVSELDYNIGVKKSELAAAAGRARNAAEIDRQLIPEFATGNFFGRGTDDQLAEMLRLLDGRRGFIAGGQLGVDRHLGLFADGEAILNQQQQIKINQVAGFDVLAEAGIPNYPRTASSPTVPRFETGAFFGTNAASSSSNSSNQTKPQFNVTVVINSSGMVESDIMDVVVDGISNNFEVQTALVKNDKKSKRFRE